MTTQTKTLFEVQDDTGICQNRARTQAQANEQLADLISEMEGERLSIQAKIAELQNDLDNFDFESLRVVEVEATDQRLEQLANSEARNK